MLYVVVYDGIGGDAGRSACRCASISSAKEKWARIPGHHRLCGAWYGPYIPSAISVLVTTQAVASPGEHDQQDPLLLGQSVTLAVPLAR